MQKIESRPSEASKKAHERSEFRVAFAFSKFTKTETKKLPQESSETRFNRV